MSKQLSDTAKQLRSLWELYRWLPSKQEQEKL